MLLDEGQLLLQRPLALQCLALIIDAGRALDFRLLWWIFLRRKQRRGGRQPQHQAARQGLGQVLLQ